MQQKDSSNGKTADGVKAKNKGESMQSNQKGAASVSKKGDGRHRKDDSDTGAKKNTTKKQSNNV